MFDPNEYCCIEGLEFDLPNNLVWCDEETLFMFPHGELNQNRGFSSLISICSDEEFNDTTGKTTFFIQRKCLEFGSGSDVQDILENSDIVSRGYGLSVRSLLILGELLDCHDSLISKNASRICIEQIYEFSKLLVDSLKKVFSDNYYDLAKKWCREIAEYYIPVQESIRSRRTGRPIWQYYAEYQHEHYDIEYFYNSLIQMDELLVYMEDGSSLYFMVEY